MSKQEQHFNMDNWVEKSLKSEPAFTLPDDFADKMALRIEKRLALNQYIKEFLIYAGVLAGLSVIAGLLGYFLIADTWARWISLLLPNIEIAAGIAVIVLFILFADRVLLRYFSFILEPGQKN